MKKLIWFALIIALCVFLWESESTPTMRTIQVAPIATSTPAETLNPPDPRLATLAAFFTAHECPPVNFSLIPDYLAAADLDNLDYRILPAISLQESSCAKDYPVDSRNIWGWNSARTGFETLQSGLYFISEQLAEGRHYAGKTLTQKLTSYNSLQYAKRVETIMQEIAPNP